MSLASVVSHSSLASKLVVCAAAALAFSASLSACGDDDDSKTTGGSTAGSGGSTSAGSGGAGGKGMIPRMDASVAEEDPIPECSRFGTNTCDAGKTCDLLVRISAANNTAGYYTGCVDTVTERAEGDPCDYEITNLPPYQTEGLTDEVYRDPCGDGLVCVPNAAVRGAGICAKACSTTQLGFEPGPCASPDEFCSQDTQIAESCHKPDSCSIASQTGCPDDQACYAIPNDSFTKFLPICSPVPTTVPDDGELCNAGCKKGSICAGPVHTPVDGWTAMNVKCRPVCGEGVTASDEDAGVPAGGCPTGTQCEPFSESTWAPNLPAGQCSL